MKIVSIILARSGSKAIKHKNLLKFKRQTLLERAIYFSLSCKFIDRTIVSTDSKKYQAIALKAGGECPSLRPKKISQDDSKDIQAFLHCLNYLKKKDNYKPDICINLRTTYPMRRKRDFKYGIDILKKNKKIQSIKSVYKLTFPIEKTWHITKQKLLKNTIATFKRDVWNFPRQMFKKAYVQNGNVDIVRTEVIQRYRSLSGSKIFPIIQNHFFDIDDIKDYKKIKNKLR